MDAAGRVVDEGDPACSVGDDHAFGELLEHGLALGGAITLVGFVMALVIVVRWLERGLGELSEERLAVLAASLIIVGIQVFFSSFLLSILGLRRTK